MATASLHYNRCLYPDCNKPRYVESSGYVHQFCGRTHALLYRSPSPTRSMIKPQQSVDQRYSYHSLPSTSSSSSSFGTRGNYSSSLSHTHTARGPLKADHKLHVLNGINSSSSDSGSKTIQFYNRHKPYYEFTNFYPSPVNIDGKVWPTSEHYFQAQKFIGTPYCEYIRKLPAPRDAFQFSRDPNVSKWERKDWTRVKDNVMFKALSAKFTQHTDLKKKLLSTKDKELVEHTDRDSYWGDGGDGRGLNKLGKLLMEVRDILIEKEKRTATKFLSQQPTSLTRSQSFSDLRSHTKDKGHRSQYYYGTSETPSTKKATSHYNTDHLFATKTTNHQSSLRTHKRCNSLSSIPLMSLNSYNHYVSPTTETSRHTSSCHETWKTGNSPTLPRHITSGTHNSHSSNPSTFYSKTQDDFSLSTGASHHSIRTSSVADIATPNIRRKHNPAVHVSVIGNNYSNRSPSSRAGTASSVDYDIITNKEKQLFHV